MAQAAQSDEAIWRSALRCFGARDWWMAHELLEQLWKRHPGTDDACLYQGLLQAAVCLYHYGNGNFSGARILARSSIELLAPLPDNAHGLKLGAYRKTFATTVEPLLTSESELRPIDPKDLPVL